MDITRDENTKSLCLCIEIRHYKKSFLNYSIISISDAKFSAFFVKSKFFKIEKMKDIFTKMNYQLMKEENNMKLVINLEMRDIDVLVDSIIDERFGVETEKESMKLLNSILKSINASARGDAKIELVQTLLNWINSTNIANDVLATYIEKGGKGKNFLEKLGLEIGEIKLEKL